MPTTHHVGFAGEAVVVREFSVRGYIVSLPMIDLDVMVSIRTDR